MISHDDCPQFEVCRDNFFTALFNGWNHKSIQEAIAYRIPKEVTEYTARMDSIHGLLVFDLCPTCDGVIERTYQAYCDSCGQKLKWIAQTKMRDRAEARFGKCGGI